MAGEAGAGGAAVGMASFLDAIAPTVVALRGFYDAVKGVSNLFKALPKAVDDFKAAFDALPMSGIKSAFGDLFKVTALATTSIADSIPYFGAIVAVAGSLFSAFVALLPAVLQTAAGLFQLGLAALPGGLKVFGDVIDYLTSVIGQALTPIVITLMSGLLTMADALRGPMQAAMQGVADLLVGPMTAALAYVTDWLRNASSKIALLITAIDMFVAGITASTQVVISGFISGINSMIDVINKMVSSTFEVINGFRKFAGIVLGIGAALAGGAALRQTAANLREKDLSAPGKVEHVGDVSKGLKIPNIAGLMKNLLPGNPIADVQDQIKNKESVINALQAELGKKGQVGYSGIADVQKQVQMAAIQNDIQARTLQTQIDTLEVNLQQLNELKKRVLPTTK